MFISQCQKSCNSISILFRQHKNAQIFTLRFIYIACIEAIFRAKILSFDFISFVWSAFYKLRAFHLLLLLLVTRYMKFSGKIIYYYRSHLKNQVFWNDRNFFFIFRWFHNGLMIDQCKHLIVLIENFHFDENTNMNSHIDKLTMIEKIIPNILAFNLKSKSD